MAIGLTHLEARVLEFLRTNGTTTPREIAAATGIALADVAAALVGFHHQKWITFMVGMDAAAPGELQPIRLTVTGAEEALRRSRLIEEEPPRATGSAGFPKKFVPKPKDLAKTNIDPSAHAPDGVFDLDAIKDDANRMPLEVYRALAQVASTPGMAPQTLVDTLTEGVTAKTATVQTRLRQLLLNGLIEIGDKTGTVNITEHGRKLYEAEKEHWDKAGAEIVESREKMKPLFSTGQDLLPTPQLPNAAGPKPPGKVQTRTYVYGDNYSGPIGGYTAAKPASPPPQPTAHSGSDIPTGAQEANVSATPSPEDQAKFNRLVIGKSSFAKHAYDRFGASFLIWAAAQFDKRHEEAKEHGAPHDKDEYAKTLLANNLLPNGKSFVKDFHFWEKKPTEHDVVQIMCAAEVYGFVDQYVSPDRPPFPLPYLLTKLGRNEAERAKKNREGRATRHKVQERLDQVLPLFKWLTVAIGVVAALVVAVVKARKDYDEATKPTTSVAQPATRPTPQPSP